MKVSVLIHNRDRAAELDACLASVATQRHRPLQVIVHDAGSMDSSPEVIHRWVRRLNDAGIDTQAHPCEPKGVAASRNDLVARADGELLFFLDNDATLCGEDALARAASMFLTDESLGLLSARVVLRDGPGPDPMAWVFRRDPRDWWSRPFDSFTFAATAACVRSSAFRNVGGFWPVLPYAREEEDLAFGLIDHGWTIRYEPTVAINHYPAARGRMSPAERRRVELRNGVMVLWRRLPALAAPGAIVVRIATSARRCRREQQSLRTLLTALPDAARMWRRDRCQRAPVRWSTFRRYLLLQRPGEVRP